MRDENRDHKGHWAITSSGVQVLPEEFRAEHDMKGQGEEVVFFVEIDR